MPPYKIGIGDPPPYNTSEHLNQEYYSGCLQMHIETIEQLLDFGLGLAVDGAPQTFGTEFDLDDLLRMDTATRVDAAQKSLNGGGLTFNEARHKWYGLPAVPGGNAVLSQQQNFSIEALAKRDADDPFAKPAPAPAAQAALPPGNEEEEPIDAKAFTDAFEKALAA